jgi:HlyD family secretion protein
MKMKKKIIGLLVMVLCVATGSFYYLRNRSQVKKVTAIAAEHLVVASMQRVDTPLFFHGMLAPQSTEAVLSPVDGTVKTTFFKYGVKVAKGQKLFSITSQQLRDTFNQDLDSYLQKRSVYEIQKTKFKGTQDLYNHGIISRDDYVSEKNTFDSMGLNYSQAKAELEKVLAKVHVDPKQVENLTYAQDQQVKDSLSNRFSNIVVKAPQSGVALFPLPDQTSSGSDDSADGKVVSGTGLKEGQLMVSIGDLSGYRANLQVNEVQVNKVKPNMKVRITGNAFPGIVIPGVVDSVAQQASPANAGSGMSLFNISVVAPKLPLAAEKIIHVGMTCQVEIIIPSKPMLMVPMGAVKHNQRGEPFVEVATATGKKQVQVLTGLTTPAGEVAIVQGLKQGEKVYARS